MRNVHYFFTKTKYSAMFIEKYYSLHEKIPERV